MKIKILKSMAQCLTREYDLTNCSAEELEKSLILHCENVPVDPDDAIIIIPTEFSYRVVKNKRNKILSMREAAVELLRIHKGTTETETNDMYKKGWEDCQASMINHLYGWINENEINTENDMAKVIRAFKKRRRGKK